MNKTFTADDFSLLPENETLKTRVEELLQQEYFGGLVFAGVYGSHLYGLHRNGSDVDVKGVYMPTLRSVVFNQHKETIERQSDEFDSTFYSCQKLIACLARADIVTMDMIHTGDSQTIVSSRVWDKLRRLRGHLYNKEMRGILGYIKTQTAKYGHKIDRVEELRNFLNLCTGADIWFDRYSNKEDVKIVDTVIPKVVVDKNYKFIKFIPEGLTEITNQPIQAAIEICGKKYQTSAQLSYMIDGIKNMLGQYGGRVENSIKSGGDWKAMSHSLRGIIQLEEIIETGDLQFPLKRAPEIMKVKLGEIPADVAASLVTEGCDRVSEKLEKSGFPDKPNMAPMMDVIMNHYGS